LRILEGILGARGLPEGGEEGAEEAGQSEVEVLLGACLEGMVDKHIVVGAFEDNHLR
jgi:hypothetical protein